MENFHDDPLDAVGIRVLGSLVEKETTTPDNYPLTLNSIVSACNQTSNRDPVMDLTEPEVSAAVDELARRLLVRQVYKSESRAKRYRHSLGEALHLHPAELAVMGVLMLRGPQTAGEIRTRTARLFEFRDVPHVEVTLQSLMTLSVPLVVQMPRRPGQKEVRFAHLLAGQPLEDTTYHTTRLGSDMATGFPSDVPARLDRIATLEQSVESLRAEMAELQARFEEFKREFQ